MIFEIKKEDTFNIEQTLECGQVFRFKKTNDGYILFSKNHYINIVEKEDSYLCETDNKDYFLNYFDLDNNYLYIQNKYKEDKFLSAAIEHGKGIHLLKQDKVETIISFLISQNNHIPRIKGIIERICEKLGDNMGSYYAFPSLEKLASVGESFYKEIGAGYRAAYLDRVSKALQSIDLESWDKLETDDLRKELMSLYGVGRKVADCILLFAFSRYDVFPVDTWIKKVYKEEFGDIDAQKMSEMLIKKYGKYAGFVQQWIFFYKRSLNK